MYGAIPNLTSIRRGLIRRAPMRGFGAATPIADSPPTTLRIFNGPADTVHEMVKQIRGPRGVQSTLVRSLKDHIVREIQPKDYLSEILAVRNFVAEKVRYSNDALIVEQVQDPERITDQIVRFGRAVGDCDDIANIIACLTLQLGRESDFVTVGFGLPGTPHSHIFARAKEPRSGEWIILDPVAGTNEDKMQRRVTSYQTWKID